MALAVLRLIGEEVRKDRTTRVIAQLPVDVSTFLINEKREWLHRLESQREIDIVLVPDPNMQTPRRRIGLARERQDELPIGGPGRSRARFPVAGGQAARCRACCRAADCTRSAGAKTRRAGRARREWPGVLGPACRVFPGR